MGVSILNWHRSGIDGLAMDASGVALVEFAICLPFLMLLYLGSYQLQDAIACNRKVSTTARAIADLTSQYATLSPGEADTILTAGGQIMTPFAAANASYRVTQLYTDTHGVTTVQWSRAKNAVARVTGTVVTVPGTMAVNDNYLIYSEVSYNYTPIAKYGIGGAIVLADSTYMSPRVSTLVRLQ